MRTIKRTLIDGVEIGGKRALEFEMRAATAGDMFDAEGLAPADRPVSYEGALIACQLVRLGDVPGPIGMEVIRRLTPRDFDLLHRTRKELDVMGKSPSSGGETGTT